MAKISLKTLSEIATTQLEIEKKKRKSKERKARLNKKSSLSPLKNLEFGKLINKMSSSKKSKARKGGNNEKLSFKSLNKMITTLHPTDPETHERLPLGDSVTVSKYGLKLVDAIGCLLAYNV